MAVSFATINPANLELSPQRVKYKTIDLGATLGNVAVGVETMKADLKADQMGETVIDRKVSGHKFSVAFELAEVKYMDNWKVVFPNVNFVTSGGNKAAFFDSQVGRADSTDAGNLLLHPLSLPDADLSQDYLFYKAISEAKAELVYGPSAQVKMKVTMYVLPDFTTQPARFMFHGDPSVGLIAASAASPVYVGTGNGTLTGVSVFSGVTKTETITIKCIAAQSNAGLFQVSGSLSGQLGVATVAGGAFVSSVIAFTLNDGSTDFVANDQFTIATTAANYV